MWDLVKTRHGRKYFVKAIKVAKDYGWRTTLASLTVKVADIPLYLHHYLAQLRIHFRGGGHKEG